MGIVFRPQVKQPDMFYSHRPVALSRTGERGDNRVQAGGRNRREAVIVTRLRCLLVRWRQNSRIRPSARLRQAYPLSSFRTPYVLVLQDGELLDDERWDCRPNAPIFWSEQEVTRLRSVTLLSRIDQLPGICTRLVGIGGKVAHHAVHVYHLVDVARNQPVVISLFGKVHDSSDRRSCPPAAGHGLYCARSRPSAGRARRTARENAGRVPAPRRGGSVKDPARGRASATRLSAHRSFPCFSANGDELHNA